MRELIKSEKTESDLPGHDQIIYPCGAYKKTFQLLHNGYTDEEVVWLTRTIIAMLVNDNTEKIRQVLKGGREESVWLRRFNSLIEAIWSMVGDLAVKTEQQSEKAYARQCEECGEMFFSNDRRQKFCPPIEGLDGHRQSTCGLRSRQRTYRKRKREAQQK